MPPIDQEHPRHREHGPGALRGDPAAHGHGGAAGRVPRLPAVAAPAAQHAAPVARDRAGADADRDRRRADGRRHRPQHGARLRPGRSGRLHPLSLRDQGHARRRRDVRDDRHRHGLRPGRGPDGGRGDAVRQRRAGDLRRRPPRPPAHDEGLDQRDRARARPGSASTSRFPARASSSCPARVHPVRQAGDGGGARATTWTPPASCGCCSDKQVPGINSVSIDDNGKGGVT